MRDSSRTCPLGGSRGIASIALAVVLIMSFGVLTSCAPAATVSPAGKIGTTTAPTDTTAETQGALEAVRVLATAIADKDEVLYASVWDNDAIAGSLYEPFIAEVLKDSPGFARLAKRNGRGNDVEGLLREVTPKENLVSVTELNAAAWGKLTLDLTGATAVRSNGEVRVTAKTSTGGGIVLVLEQQGSDWRIIAVEGAFRDTFIKVMLEGFESAMPK